MATTFRSHPSNDAVKNLAAAISIPLEAVRPRRTRQRRVGSRAPLPLIPIIAVCAGIAIAYVAQTAHYTQSTYQVSDLNSQQSQLNDERQQLTSQLAQLQSAERIDAAAQQLGMRPPAQWAYVNPAPGLINNPSLSKAAAAQIGNSSDGPMEKLVAELRGSFMASNSGGSQATDP